MKHLGLQQTLNGVLLLVCHFTERLIYNRDDDDDNGNNNKINDD
jgi:hypothetical protein